MEPLNSVELVIKVESGIKAAIEMVVKSWNNSQPSISFVDAKMNSGAYRVVIRRGKVESKVGISNTKCFWISTWT